MRDGEASEARIVFYIGMSATCKSIAAAERLVDPGKTTVRFMITPALDTDLSLGADQSFRVQVWPGVAGLLHRGPTGAPGDGGVPQVLSDQDILQEGVAIFNPHNTLGQADGKFVRVFALLAQRGTGVARDGLTGKRGLGGPEALAVINDIARLDGGPGRGHGEGAEDQQVQHPADSGSHHIDLFTVFAHGTGTHVWAIHTTASPIGAIISSSPPSVSLEHCVHGITHS